MLEWTDSARAELNGYLEKIRPNCESSGADPLEVSEDIIRHIDEEIAAANLSIVTEGDIKKFLAHMGFPEHTGADESIVASNKPPARPKPSGLRIAFIVLAGIIWPTAVILIELTTRFCARNIFNPLPTIWHTLACLFVPLAGAIVLFSSERVKREHGNKLTFISGIAIGIAGFYALIFMPLLPLSLLAIIFLIGFLSLCPLLALTAAIMNHNLFRRVFSESGAARPHGVWLGIAAGVLFLLILALPSTVTQVGLQMATSSDPNTSRRGTSLLRKIGNRELMLEYCYSRQRTATDLVGFLFTIGDRVTSQDARKAYYRVTGVPFNSVQRHERFGNFRFNDWGFDEDLGGMAVGEVREDVSLVSSLIDGSVDPDAALSYLEWTMIFENSGSSMEEARSQIVLPPGGVVSRLTLWIDGEEREAAFAGRSKVREAYRDVVHKRRDPVLVTSSGPDRILLQCFPVMPEETMKVRIGITSPLLLADRSHGYLKFPYFVEKNFGVADEIRHSVWVESEEPIEMSDKDFIVENPEDGLYAVRGTLDNRELGGSAIFLPLGEDNGLKVWTYLDESTGEIIRQYIGESKAESPQHIVLVIDGSYSMGTVDPSLYESFNNIPADKRVSVIVASDEIVELSESAVPATEENLYPLIESLKNFQFAGGCDNVPALALAWEKAAQMTGSVIVWIHGPQPMEFQPVEGLRQKWERRPNGPHMYDIQLVPGRNIVMEKLCDLGALRTIRSLSSAAEDLDRLFSGWAPGSKEYMLVREKASLSGLSKEDLGERTSNHLAKLWAFDEVSKLIAEKDHDEATRMAVAHHLVTSASGAVVLETQAQYDIAGLTPVAPGEVPTIPEPATWMMLCVAAAVLLFALSRRNRILCKSE